MVERCAERNVFAHCDYTAIDADADNVAAAEARLPQRLTRLGYASTEAPPSGDRDPANGHAFCLRAESAHGVDDTRTLSVCFEQADLFDFAVRADQRQRYDAVIAHAFLDLVDVQRALSLLAGLLRTRGLLYLTINFDGATIFEPAIDSGFDAEIERQYHRTMDSRIVDGQPSGDSRTGRHLFGHLSAHMDVLAAGSSDWVVFAGRDGYPGDEAYFLHFIIDTMHDALAEKPLVGGERFEEWIRRRHEQVDTGELVYIAHQLDFLARLPD